VLFLQPPVLKTSQCLWSSFVIFSSKGKKTKENQKTKTNKQNLKFKCNTVSVSPSASSAVVSSKEEKKKKRGCLETALWMSIWVCGSPASLRACLEVLAGERSYSYTLDRRTVLLYRGWSSSSTERAASGGTHMERWGRKGTPA
jgi:hypothetical protein